MSLGMTPREFWGMVRRGKRVGPIDRQLLQAVALNDRSRCACGHSTLDTVNMHDIGHFGIESVVCEACRVRETDEQNKSFQGRGVKRYVVDKRM